MYLSLIDRFDADIIIRIRGLAFEFINLTVFADPWAGRVQYRATS